MLKRRPALAVICEGTLDPSDLHVSVIREGEEKESDVFTEVGFIYVDKIEDD
jgi:hypothetical protein